MTERLLRRTLLGHQGGILHSTSYETKGDLTKVCFWVLVHLVRGSAVANIIGGNVHNFEHFNNEVKMWVFEEQVDGRNLTDIINTQHENVKYVPQQYLLDRGG